MSYPRSQRARIRRDGELQRAIDKLERGVLPENIPGDRDVIVAAMEIVQRRADVADDLPEYERASWRNT